MQRVHKYLGIGAALLVPSILLISKTATPTPQNHPNDKAAERLSDELDSTAAAHERQTAPRNASGGGREPGREAAGSLDTRDPCASLASALNEERAARTAQEQENQELRKELTHTLRELHALQFLPDTPYGAFLTGYEVDAIGDPYVLMRIKEWLDQFPVHLRTGEAAWIAERTLTDDWKRFANTSERALIDFLGPTRLAAELPSDRLAELRAKYSGRVVFE